MRFPALELLALATLAAAVPPPRDVTGAERVVRLRATQQDGTVTPLRVALTRYAGYDRLEGWADPFRLRSVTRLEIVEKSDALGALGCRAYVKGDEEPLQNRITKFVGFTDKKAADKMDPPMTVEAIKCQQPSTVRDLVMDRFQLAEDVLSGLAED